MVRALLKENEDRREAIIAIARDAFFSNGYAGTSMSSIAVSLGGSKTTLWSYFPNKPALFIAVADDLIAQYDKAVTSSLVPGGEIEATLRAFGRLLLSALLSDSLVALIRLVTGENGRFPELGSRFHERGIGRGWTVLKAYLDDAVLAGQIQVEDTLFAAQHFIALCQSRCYQRAMMGDTPHPSKTEIDQDIDAAVAIFLRAYQRIPLAMKGW